MFSNMAEGLERVARLIAVYSDTQYVLQGYSTSHKLVEALVRLYGTILTYFANAIRFYGSGVISPSISPHHRSICDADAS
jgi:hypothetical protein